MIAGAVAPSGRGDSSPNRLSPSRVPRAPSSVALVEDEFDRRDEFEDRVRAIERQIRTAPASFPRALDASGEPEEIRDAQLGRFPYRLIFIVEAERAVIVAVAHLRRRHGYWRQRKR